MCDPFRQTKSREKKNKHQNRAKAQIPGLLSGGWIAFPKQQCDREGKKCLSSKAAENKQCWAANGGENIISRA